MPRKELRVKNVSVTTGIQQPKCNIAAVGNVCTVLVKETNKEIWSKTSTSLHYAMLVENNRSCSHPLSVYMAYCCTFS